MSSATVRRGKTVNRARKKPARKQVRQISWFDRLLQSLPFTQAEVQRFLTWCVLGVVVLVGLLIANWFGVPKMAYQQFGLMTAKAGFEVEYIEPVGMKRVDQLKVYDIVLDEMEQPILLVDLDQIRSKLLTYGWIKDARVSRQLPNRLYIEITERKPVAVWNNGGNYRLLDDEGKVLDKISQAEIGNLPVVSGANANKHLVELGELLDKAQSLKSQVVGASWVGNRRWDLQFKSGKTVALPEGEELAGKALVNFTRMDGIHRLLERNIIHFDLRDPDRMYMREAPKVKSEASEATKPAPKISAGAEGSA
jgi:cell division protein FtsQ